MVKESKVTVKLTDAQLKKMKIAVENETGTTLRISFKIFNGYGLPHQLLLTTRHKIKFINAFNMSTDIKISKAQISKAFVSEDF